MDLRDSKSRLILIVIALGAALVIAVASCGGGGDDGDSADGSGKAATETESETDDDAPGDGSPKDEEPADGTEEAPEGEVLAEVTGDADLKLTVTSAVREQGGFLTVTGTLRNQGSENWDDVTWRGTEKELRANSTSMAGASVVDKTAGKRYLILRDTEGRCLCTQFSSGVKAGETEEWFAQFPAPPADVREVDFNIGSMSPATIELTKE